MESKVSNAQLEVWEWKEKVYQLIKNMPTDKGVEFILDQVRETSKEMRSTKKTKK